MVFSGAFVAVGAAGAVSPWFQMLPRHGTQQHDRTSNWRQRAFF